MILVLPVSFSGFLLVYTFTVRLCASLHSPQNMWPSSLSQVFSDDGWWSWCLSTDEVKTCNLSLMASQCVTLHYIWMVKDVWIKMNWHWAVTGKKRYVPFYTELLLQCGYLFAKFCNTHASLLYTRCLKIVCTLQSSHLEKKFTATNHRWRLNILFRSSPSHPPCALRAFSSCHRQGTLDPECSVRALSLMVSFSF